MMGSKILHRTADTARNGHLPTSLYDNVKHLNDGDENDNDVALYENVSSFQKQKQRTPVQNIIYDVPKSNESIYAQPKLNSTVSVESLIPQAARLILAQTPKISHDNLSDKEVNGFSDSEDFGDDEAVEYDDEEDYEEVEQDTHRNNDAEPPIPPPDYDFGLDDFRDSSYNDYGLEVIQEETESQMSSDSDQELDRCSDVYSETIRQRKCPSREQEEDLVHQFTVHDYSSSNSNHSMGLSAENEIEDSNPKSLPEEIVMKHIRIPNDWDPDTLLRRLYAVYEPKQITNGTTPCDRVSGYLSILSGNRKKGTFWNAWKRKFYVVGSGKISGFEKEDCQDLFQCINLIGGKVDFLDPTEFVGVEQGKTMTNRIVGVDDGKGHYFVFQCTSASEALRWVGALQAEVSSSHTFAIPILSKSPSTFRDVFLLDIGSTNVRAGVLTHQPTLPSVFMGAVMSENVETGRCLYGNDVYLPENRKKAKIRFPFECTSKLCQNTLDVSAIKGFLLKIFTELNLRPENYRVIVNLPRRVDNNCRKNILQLLFNTFEVRSALLCHQSVMAFWAYSAENGIVCDIGERCDVIPVSQGFVLSHGWGRAPLGGHQLKHALRQGLGPQENGLYLSTPAENLALRFISENFICTSGGGGRKLSQEAQEIVVEMDLRDVISFSSLIGINQDVLRGVAEGFFDPGYYGVDCDPIQKILYKSLQDCGVDIRKEMSQNIFLVGGCTLIPGFAERLEFELTKLCPPHLKPKIQSSPYRYHASFIGASVVAETEAFEKSLLQRVKYDSGPGPAHWFI